MKGEHEKAPHVHCVFPVAVLATGVPIAMVELEGQTAVTVALQASMATSPPKTFLEKKVMVVRGIVMV